MKALSFTQPWATLVALGAKRIETRSWTTSYRGLLAIHAAKRFPAEAVELCWQEPFRSALEAGGYYAHSASSNNPFQLPLGAVVAVVTLIEVRRIGIDDVPAEPERTFGNYIPGRYAWFFQHVHRLPEPVAARGSLGLWTWNSPASSLIGT